MDACLKLSRNISYDNKTGHMISNQTNREFKSAQSMETRNGCVDSVTEAIQVKFRHIPIILPFQVDSESNH